MFAGAVRAALRGKRNTALSNHMKGYSMATLFKKPQDEYATIHWLNENIKRGKAGVHTARAVITPGVAAEILNRNPDNRNISPTKADHYARDMINGEWQENGETIIFSCDGLLNDGQHRMQAVIDSNCNIPFLFVFGVPRSSRTTVDQGKARSAGDFLSMDGILYAKNAATLAKFVIAYEKSEGKSLAPRPFITNAEITSRVRADEAIIQSAAYAHHNLKAYRTLLSHTVMGACHYILSEIDAADAKAFLDEIGLGEGIKRGDPSFAVRSAFLAAKRERQEAMEIIFHGWNAYRQGRTIKQCVTRGVFPALV